MHHAAVGHTENHMDRMMKFAAVGAAALVLVLVLVYGPVIAAFAVAGSAFGVMFTLMVMEALHAVGRWRLELPWTLHRHTRTKT